MLALPETQVIVKTYFETFKGISQGSPFQDLLNLAQVGTSWSWLFDTIAQLCGRAQHISHSAGAVPLTWYKPQQSFS